MSPRMIGARLLCGLATVLFLVPAATAQTAVKSAETSKAKSDDLAKISPMRRFLRIRKDDRGRALALQTSVTRYVTKNADGERVTVDLIGVVHIGEKDYYDHFNKAFQKYDGMLYELVAPKGTVIPKGGRMDEGGLNPVAALQKGMQKGLGLEFQLEHIDYTKKNFVHADMSPEEFGESMKKNDESIGKMFLRAMGQSMAMQSSGQGGSELSMLRAMISGDKMSLRRQAANQIQNMESGMIMFQGKNGSTIIDHRNAKCMEVLQQEIAAGKTNLAIFYGAGHLPDMERRLESEFKMKRGGQYWLDAWRLRKPKK